MRATVIEPGYINLYRSGELERRVKFFRERLATCDICPRACGINRLEDREGFCHSGYLPVVSSICAHHGEEPVLSGTRGSGTIFFANCNMRCAYCQNYQISQDWQKQNSKTVDFRVLAEKMIYLQNELGCHNINLVSPSHFVPQILRSVLEAVPMGLKIPLFYNTSGYDSVDTIRSLDGIISIYLPDIRYASDKWAKEFSSAPDYVTQSRLSIKEMYRQVGNLIVDESGVARRGLIVRHLVLPNGLAGSEDSLNWLASELSPSVTVSIMAQYFPAYRAPQIPLLSRRITKKEYNTVLKLMSELGLENGWLQEMDASDNYVPDFEREGHPFLPGPQGI